MCAHRLLTLAANQWPHRIAYSWDIDPRSSSLPQELTYAQLLEWAQATAASLKAEHFEGLHLDVSALGRPLIAIAIDEGPLLVLAMAAAWIAGTAIVPIDASEPLPRLRGLLEDAHPHLVLAPACHIDRLAEASKYLTSALVDFETTALMALEQVHCGINTSIISSISTNPDSNDTSSSSCSSCNDDADYGNMEAVSYIWYTSGSTGFPKGCVMPVRAILAYGKARNQTHRIVPKPQARVLLASAFTFDPCVGDVVSCWASGACLCLPSIHSDHATMMYGNVDSNGGSSSSSSNDSLDDSLGATLHRTKASHVCSTPALFAPLAAQGWTPATLPHLRVVALGGEPAPPAVLAAWGGGDGLPVDLPLAPPQPLLPSSSLDTPEDQVVGSIESREILRRRNARVLLLNTYGVTEVCCYQTAAILHPPMNHRNVGSNNSNGNDNSENKLLCAKVASVDTSSGNGMIEDSKISKGSDNSDDKIGQEVQDGWLQLNLPHSTKPGCAGSALPGCLVWTVKPGTLEAVDEPGQEGEVCLGGPQVAHGYWRRPDLSTAKFLQRNDATLGPPCSEGTSSSSSSSSSSIESSRFPTPELVYLTGDLGRWHSASHDSTSTFGAQSDGTRGEELGGWLELLGRADAQLKVHGRRMEAGEVEALFLAGDDHAIMLSAETKSTGAASATSGVVTSEAIAEVRTKAAFGAVVDTSSEHIKSSEMNPLRTPRMLQACAATVAADGRLAVLVVPTSEVWTECFATKSDHQSVNQSKDGKKAAEAVIDGDSSDDNNRSSHNDSDDNGGVWEHEGLSLALRRRAAVASPEALVPSIVAFVQILPLTATGKVARGTLSDLIAKRKPRVHPSAMKAVAEVDEIKNGDAINAGLIFKGSQNSISSDSSSISKAKALAATVAKLWERLLGLAPGSVDLEVDDFSSLGGDSLLALRASRELVQVFFDSNHELSTTNAEDSSNSTVDDSKNDDGSSVDAPNSNKVALHELLGGDTGTLRGALAPRHMLGPGRTALRCATDLLAANYAAATSSDITYHTVAAAPIDHATAAVDVLPPLPSPPPIQHDRSSSGHTDNTKMGNVTDTSAVGSAESGNRLDDSRSNDGSRGGTSSCSGSKEEQSDRLLDRALRRAASAGEPSLVGLLAHIGADFGPRLKKKSSSSSSILHATAKDDAEEDQNYDYDQESSAARRPLKQQTPLHMAAASGHASVVQSLISLGADPRATDSSGRMASHAAAQSPNPAVLGLLLQEGVCPLTAKDKNKQTVLHHAARSGFAATLQHALQRWLQPPDSCYINRPGTGGGGGAKAYSRLQGGVLDWRDRWGRTPIHWCVLNQHVDCLELLLAAGADPEPGSARGLHKRTSLRPETPLGIARRLRSEVDSAAAQSSSSAELLLDAAEVLLAATVPLLNVTEIKTEIDPLMRQSLCAAQIEALLLQAAEAKE